MAPVLLAGDHIVGDMRTMSVEQLRGGDVLLVLAPSDSLRVKRLIGLPGDTVELRGGELLINGTSRSRPAGPESIDVPEPRVERLLAGEYVVSTADDRRGDHGPVTVPAGHVFVMGDNRGHSDDSRDWGPIPVEDVRGRMVRVHLSFAPAGTTTATGLGRIRWDRVGIEPVTTVEPAEAQHPAR